MSLAGLFMTLMLAGGATPREAASDPLAYDSLKRPLVDRHGEKVKREEVHDLVRECAELIHGAGMESRGAVKRRFDAARAGKLRPILLLEIGWITGEGSSYGYTMVEGDHLVLGLVRPLPVPEYTPPVPARLAAHLGEARAGLPAAVRGGLYVESRPNHHGCWMLTVVTGESIQQTAIYGFNTGGPVEKLIDALQHEGEGVSWDYDDEDSEEEPVEPGGSPGSLATWRLEPRGYGPARIGMTLAAVSRALGRDLDPDPRELDEDGYCCRASPMTPGEPISREQADGEWRFTPARAIA